MDEESLNENEEEYSDDEEEYEDDGEIESKDEKSAETKALAIASDLTLLQDIFSHIDTTSQRIAASLALHSDIVDKEGKLDILKKENAELRDRLNRITEETRAKDDDESIVSTASFNDDSSLSWSQYEHMNEGERARLLEKAISSLKQSDRSKNRKLIKSSKR